MQCPISHQSISGECVLCDGLCPKGTVRVWVESTDVS